MMQPGVKPASSAGLSGSTDSMTAFRGSGMRRLRPPVDLSLIHILRTMGKVGGSAVFVLDFGKGIVSGLIAAAAAAMFGGGMSLSGHVIGYDDFVTVAFLGCVWGHIFSPWLGFKGGKGIAVAVGCLFVTFGWQGACLELAIFAVLVLATKYVSVRCV